MSEASLVCVKCSRVVRDTADAGAEPRDFVEALERYVYTRCNLPRRAYVEDQQWWIRSSDAPWSLVSQYGPRPVDAYVLRDVQPGEAEAYDALLRLSRAFYLFHQEEHLRLGERLRQE